MIRFCLFLGPALFDHSHKHLIDTIRQRDTVAFIDAVESGQVNFESFNSLSKKF